MELEVRNEARSENNKAAARRPEAPPKALKKKGKGKKIAFVVIIIAAAAAAALIIPRFSNVEKPAGIPVTTGELSMTDVEDLVTVTGVVEGASRAKVMASSEYEISAVLAAEGDNVSKGQVLARLDTRALNEQQNKAAAALDASRFQYEAAKGLYEQGAMSEQEMIRAKAAYDNDLITANSFAVGEKSVIKSPISGTVTRANANVGGTASNMAAGDALFVIEDLSNLKIKARVSEYDIGKVKLGQTVTISSDVLNGKKAAGIVKHISPTGETKNSATSEMVIPVDIGITDSQGIIAGVTGKADILVAHSENALAAPIDALLEDSSGESKIFLLTGEGLLKAVPVQLGVEGISIIEVISDGLKAGDKVVLNPSFELHDGMPAYEQAPAGKP